eukprot:g2695.t1
MSLGGGSAQRDEPAQPAPEAAFRFEDLPPLDALIKEYLLWRGFTQCFRTFEAARQNDRLQFFNVQRIVDQLFSYTSAFDFASMQSLWNFLSARFFVHLDDQHQPTVRAFARALQRYYIVHCVQSGSLQNAVQFFRQYGGELAKTSASNGSDWEEWFQLPFLPNAAQDPRFAPFFTIQWRDTLRTSLSNFLTLIFSSIHVPKLLAFNLQQIQLNQCESALQSSMARVAQLESELILEREHVASLKRENTNLRNALWQNMRRQNDEGNQIFDNDNGNSMMPGLEKEVDSVETLPSVGASLQGKVGAQDVSSNGPATATLAAGKSTPQKSRAVDESNAPTFSSDNRRLLRGATRVEIFDAGDDDGRNSTPDRIRSRHGSQVSGASSVVELLFGSDDEDDVDSYVKSRDEHPIMAAAIEDENTTTRSRTIIETNGDDVLPGKRAHRISSSLSAEQKDALNLNCSNPILGHSDSILCAKFSPGGSMFASGSKDATLRVWDVIRSKNPLSLTTEGGGGDVGALSTATIAARGATCASTVYCMSQVLCLDWVPFHGRNHVLFGTSCRDIKLWDTKAQCFSAEFQSRPDTPMVTCVQHARQAANLVAITSISSDVVMNHEAPAPSRSSSWACLVELWDLEEGRSVRDIVSTFAPESPTMAQCFTPRGNMLYTGSSDGFIRVYDLKRPQAEVMKWKAHDETSVANLIYKGHDQTKTNSKMLSNEVHGNVLVSIGATHTE